MIGIFPSDHVVKDGARFAEVMRAGVSLAASGRQDCGAGGPSDAGGDGVRVYGAGRGGGGECPAGVPVRRVKRFTEKPDRARAEEFVAAGNYAWNGGIFLWSARTLARAIREHCAGDGAAAREDCGGVWDGAEFERVFAEVYPQCENISVTMRCWSRGRRRARRGRRFIACRRTLGGTIWGRGRRCMSI